MKNSSFAFLVGINLPSLIIAIIIILAISYLVNKYIKGQKEKNLKKHSLTIGLELAGEYLKVGKVCEKERIFFLSDNPSAEYPSGIGGAWYKMDGAPEELCIKSTVILIKKGEDGKVVYIKSPLF